jgi:type VI secretion system FHA domain protein
MLLNLEIVSAGSLSAGSSNRKVFSTSGGTIGRAGSSDWILSHRKVSGRHAVISYQDGVYYIVDDSSANGVFLNSTMNRLLPGKRYALKAGDRIIIDPYEIAVSFAADHAVEGGAPDQAYGIRAREPSRDPFDSIDPFGDPGLRTPPPERRTPRNPTPPPAGEAVQAEELDPLKLLGGGRPKPAPVAPRTAQDLANRSPLSDHYKPPAVPPPSAPVAPTPAPPGGIMIPADYDPLRDEDFSDPFEAEPPAPPPRPMASPPPVEVPPPAPPPPAPSPLPVAPVAGWPEPAAAERPAERRTPAPAADRPEPDAALREILAGAGLDRAAATPDLARNFGQILRVVVAGVMDVLRARQQIKDEFRMRMTQFRPADNNPLKFSANVDDALHNLLVKRNPAYLEAVEAFEDAFDDLRSHQIAILAGMRVAFESMLAQFDPEQLQAHFDRQVKRSSLLGVAAKLKYWDLYRERHEEMAKDPEATFRRLFGEEFAKAYEDQLRRLKTDARERGTPPESSR